MSLYIDNPQLSDVDELLHLYQLIYGRNYPIVYGTDADAMSEAITSESFEWLVMRDEKRNDAIVGSVVFELDKPHKVAKVSALVVHPEYGKAGIATRLVAHGEWLMERDCCLNSIYTTTRTNSIGPQLVFLHSDYVPLGIFPNSHRLRRHETTTLLAKFRKGVLSRRQPTEKIPQMLLPLYKAVQQCLPEFELPKTATVPTALYKRERREVSFEVISAPNFVQRRFKEQVKDAGAQFYPFHTPNMLLAETTGSLEMFAHFNEFDGYCTLICCNKPLYEIEECMGAIVAKLEEIGASYAEVLIGADRFDSLETLLRTRFLPSALYPGLREVDGKTHDYVIMTRTLEPLDFRGMSIEQSFKPFIDQYLALWKQMHLDSLEVFYDSNGR